MAKGKQYTFTVLESESGGVKRVTYFLVHIYARFNEGKTYVDALCLAEKIGIDQQQAHSILDFLLKNDFLGMDNMSRYVSTDKGLQWWEHFKSLPSQLGDG